MHICTVDIHEIDIKMDIVPFMLFICDPNGVHVDLHIFEYLLQILKNNDNFHTSALPIINYISISHLCGCKQKSFKLLDSLFFVLFNGIWT